MSVNVSIRLNDTYMADIAKIAANITAERQAVDPTWETATTADAIRTALAHYSGYLDTRRAGERVQPR